MNRFANICLAALLLSAVMYPAQARLFGDSLLVSRDAFSDEITGEGPDLVLVIAAAPDGWKDTVKRLRKDHRVHLIHVTAATSDTAEALDAYLVKAGLTPVILIAPTIIADYLGSHHSDHVKKAITAETPAQVDDAALKS